MASVRAPVSTGDAAGRLERLWNVEYPVGAAGSRALRGSEYILRKCEVTEAAAVRKCTLTPFNATGALALPDKRELNRFLADVDRRALRIAEIAVRDRDEALDIVQEAMLRLARNYGERPAAEWPPLFYRILQNGVRDWHRRQAVRRRVLVFFGRAADDEAPAFDPVAAAPDPAGMGPDAVLATDQAMRQLEAALQGLPARQREAFMLRTFEGLDTAGTATAMGVATGSVKTHYFRAVQALKATLGEDWP